jgi:hypothetical protein
MTLRIVVVRSLQTVLLLVFAALLGWYWKHGHRYSESAAHQRTEKRRIAPYPFRAGEVAPRLQVLDASGHRLILDPATWPRESFLLFALPGCPGCRSELVRAAQAGNTNFTVVSLIAGAGILKEIAPGVPVYFLEHSEVPRMQQHIDRVPHVLRISRGGKIVADCNSMVNCGPPLPACATCAL